MSVVFDLDADVLLAALSRLEAAPQNTVVQELTNVPRLAVNLVQHKVAHAA